MVGVEQKRMPGRCRGQKQLTPSKSALGDFFRPGIAVDRFPHVSSLRNKVTPTTMTIDAHSGDNVIADIVNGSVVRSYVTPMLDQNVSMTDVSGSATYYYNQDERQSVRNLTNSSAAVVQSYDYTAYGDKVDSLTSGTISQRYTYTGRELNDVSGDYYFRYRMYGAMLGIFYQRDPLGYLDGMGLLSGYFSFNLGMDPFGLAEEKSFGIKTKWILGRDHATGPGDLADQITDHIHVEDTDGKLLGKIDMKTGEADDALKHAIKNGKVSKKAIQKNMPRLIPKVAEALRQGGLNAGNLLKNLKGPYFKKVPVVGIVIGIAFVATADAAEDPLGPVAGPIVDQLPILGWAKAFVEQCMPKVIEYGPFPYIDSVPEGHPSNGGPVVHAL